MDAIFKKENVYVAIVDKDIQEGLDKKELEGFICETYGGEDVHLYGGRVVISLHNRDFEMKIDGIIISGLGMYAMYDVPLISNYLDIQTCTAYLNQIENLGVDTFLDNFKKQLLAFKDEIVILTNKYEQEQSIKFDDFVSKKLNSLRNTILKLSMALFFLMVNMNAGLENQTYIDTYNTIVNQYFE